MAERANPRQSKTIGATDTQSRAKAENAKERAVNADAVSEPTGWPHTPTGRPMVKIMMQASELIPTGQYANVTVGPAQITAFIDPNDDNPFSKDQKENVAKAVNELAEIVEADVIAVQRNLVLENLQEQVAANGKS